MSTTTTVKTVTAADVRAFFLASDKRMARLSEAAQANVRAPRGRLSNEVVKVHNRSRKVATYVQGPAGRPASAATQAKREAYNASQAARKALRKAGHQVGTRGRIPADLLAQAKG